MTGNRTTGPMSPEERNLWQGGILAAGSSATYQSGLWSEVWADGFVCLAMTGPEVAPQVLTALNTANTQTMSNVQKAVPQQPVMMDRQGVEFVGRVFVEFWSGKPLIGAMGSSDVGSLIESTKNRIAQGV